MENSRNNQRTDPSDGVPSSPLSKHDDNAAQNSLSPDVEVSTSSPSLTVIPNLQDEETYQKMREEAAAELRADKRNAQRSILRSFFGIN